MRRGRGGWLQQVSVVAVIVLISLVSLATSASAQSQASSVSLVPSQNQVPYGTDVTFTMIVSGGVGAYGHGDSLGWRLGDWDSHT
jgi:hypothetical protein